MAVQEHEVVAPGAPGGIEAGGIPLRLGDGIELLGRYQGSGFKEAPYLVRRPDGQMIQLPPLLYSVAEHLDGRRGLDDIAAEVSNTFGRSLDAEGVQYLIEEKLRPLGLLPAGKRPVQEVEAPDPLLALRLRTS